MRAGNIKRRWQINNKNTLYAHNLRRGQKILSKVTVVWSRHELLFFTDNITKNCLATKDPGGLGGSWENYTNYSQVRAKKSSFIFGLSRSTNSNLLNNLSKDNQVNLDNLWRVASQSLMLMNSYWRHLKHIFVSSFFSFTIHTCKSNFALFLWESVWVFKFLIQILNKIISIHPEKWEFEIMKVVVWESFENWEKEMYLNFLFLVLGEHNPPGGVAGKCLPGLHHFTQSYQRLMQRCRNSIVWPNLINARTRDAKMIESTSPHFGSTNKYMKCVYLKTKIFHKRKYTVPFF